MQSLWIIIPAAGQGKRFGSETPKQYSELLNKSVLEHTLERFSRRDDVAGIVIAVSASDQWIEGTLLPQNAEVIEGGRTRAESVMRCVEHLSGKLSEDDIVAVHDAARPCVRQSSLDRLFSKARYSQYGVILALPATDTIKRVDSGKILSTIDRESVYMAQTPQAFPYGLLKKALEHVKKDRIEITDDASAVEALGYSPEVVEGTKSNIKITAAEDLMLAEVYLGQLLKERD